jgi:serine protease Do
MQYIIALGASALLVLGILIAGRHLPTALAGVAQLPVYPARYEGKAGPADFTDVARAAVKATVRVSAKVRDEWGEPGFSIGSGAILTEDGFIVTNYHVVKDAGSVTVTLNNHRAMPARVIGVDAAADLAVLKIPAHKLPFFSYGNSNDLKVGEWVLAIGYPLGLETTVTAGIVSAKRESLIQTDAAVNHGSSGGPLVDVGGGLVGINASLTTSTGAYVGYSFAIPAVTVKRVVNRILGGGPAQVSR